MKFSPAEIEIVEANEQDNWDLLNFLMTSYPNLGWSKAFMQWQYFDNPAGKVKNWIAKHNGNIVANVSAIPHKLLANGKLETSWRVQDVITHPEYRGMGLYTQLANCVDYFLKKEQFSINFTFPNENSHQGFIKRNWLNPNRIPLWVNNTIQSIKPKISNLTVEPIGVFTQKDEEIWKNFCNKITFAVDRNLHYLNWRYMQNPKGGYSAFRLSTANKSAICILKTFVNSEGTKYSHLIDYFYESGFENIEDILSFYINFSIENNVKTASTWIPPQSPIAKYLNKNGFEMNLALTRWHVLNLNSVEIDEKEISHMGNWHISMGDSDVF
jgi:hypothetical protein